METHDTRWPQSVTIIGAGGIIGSSVLHEIATSGTCRWITAVEPRENVAQAHAIDVTEAAMTMGLPPPEIRIVSPEEVEPADLTVVAASRPEGTELSRHKHATVNWDLLRSLIPTIERSAMESGAVLLLSNPVDILAECLRRTSSLHPERILGFSLNDTTRFRAAIANELGRGAEEVDAWVLGEHGEKQVPVFSRVRVADEPVHFDRPARDRILNELAAWFPRWIRLQSQRSSGWTTAKGVGRVIEAMHMHAVLPSSVRTEKAPYGLKPAYLTLPSRLSPAGVTGVEAWDLNEAELAQLQAAAMFVAETADALTAKEDRLQ